MRILLPKASKGIKFDLLFTIDMNDFDVEMLLPGLFHLVRTKGRRVGKPIRSGPVRRVFRPNDSTRATQRVQRPFGSHGT